MGIALTFELTYAGVPFVSDDAHAVRLSLDGTAGGRLRKQQPERSLLEEVDRLMPFSWVSQFAPREALYDQRGLGRRLQVLDRAVKVRVGEYYYPTSALTWSVFRGLATSSAVKQMLSGTQGGLLPAAFLMNAQPSQDAALSAGRTYGIATSLYMLPPLPLGEQAGAFDGLYLITLVDERYQWQYRPVQSFINDNSTWDSLITALAAALGVSVTYTAIDPAFTTPEPDSQLWNAQGDAAALFESAALSVGRTVVRKYDGTYRLYTPAESLALAQASRRPEAVVSRLMGGDSFNSGAALPAGDLSAARQGVLPAAVRLTFPKFVFGDDPVPHFIDRRGGASRWWEDGYGDAHAIDTPLRSGGITLSGLQGSGLHHVRCTAKALYASEAAGLVSGAPPLNQSGLQALAASTASAYLQGQVATGLDETYLGVYAWEPDGLHDLLFTYSAARRVASTRVMRGEWTAAWRDVQNSTPTLSGGPISQSGSAGRSVALTVRDNATAVAMTNLLTVMGGTVSQGVRTSGGVNEAIITLVSGAAPVSGFPSPNSGDTNNFYSYNNFYNQTNFYGFFAWSWTEINSLNLYLLTQSGIGTPKASLRVASGTIIMGVAGGTSGRLMVLWNAANSGENLVGPGTGVGAFTLKHLAIDAGKMYTPLCRDYVVWPGDSVILEWDATSGAPARPYWRMDHPTFGAGLAPGGLGAGLWSGVSGGVVQYSDRLTTYGSGLGVHLGSEDGGIEVFTVDSGLPHGTATGMPTSAVSGVYTDVASVNLPAHGTFLVLADGQCSVSDDSPSTDVRIRLYNSTIPQAYDDRIVVFADGLRMTTYQGHGCATLTGFVITSGQETVKLQVRMDIAGTIPTASCDQSRISYVRIGPGGLPTP